MTTAQEPLSPVDAAWLRMDGPTNRMTITSLLRFEGKVGYDELLALVRDRVLRYDRFRQRVEHPALGRPRWSPDPDFDVRAHVHRIGLPSPGDDAALADLVADLASTPLDTDKPLWQMHLVEMDGGSSAIVRLHHAIGDGVALVHMLLGLTDEGSDDRPVAVGQHLAAVPHRPLDVARMAATHATTLGHLLLLPSDPPSPLSGALGRTKRIAWTEPTSVVGLKEVARRYGAKLNDVLLSAVAGTLRSYLVARGFDVTRHEVRALVPVFFHGLAEGGELGNHFGLVFAPLPVGLADPMNRLRETKTRMDAVKASDEATVALEVLGAMGLASADIEKLGIDIFTRKATAMVTNVPGPPSELHLAGHVLRDLLVWAPVSGHLGLGISFLSYAGRVRVGVIADAGLVPDATELTHAFEAELARILALP